MERDHRGLQGVGANREPGGERGYSPLIPGDNDGVVEVASTKLDGMTDHLVLPVLHTTMMANTEVIRQTKHFLEHGRFDRKGS